MSFKERYHFAKLALFNARLLSELAGSSNPAVARAVDVCAKKNGFQESVPLINQAVFLQMAYVCLVWLWEGVKLEKKESSLTNTLFDGEFNLPAVSVWEGQRKHEASEVLRLLRNAISHGRVHVSEGNFRFEDQKPDGSDKAALTISWAYLGQLCERVIHKLTSVAYPVRD